MTWVINYLLRFQLFFSCNFPITSFIITSIEFVQENFPYIQTLIKKLYDLIYERKCIFSRGL